MRAVKKEKGDNLYLSNYSLSIFNSYSQEMVTINVDGLLISNALDKNFLKVTKDSTFIFAGLLQFDKGQYELETMELLDSTKLGLFCENQEELDIFTELELSNKTYKKEHFSIPEYNNILPNGVIFENNKISIIDIENQGDLSDKDNFILFNKE